MSNATRTKLSGQVFNYALLSAVSFAGNLGLTVWFHEWAGVSSFLAVPMAMALITLFNFYAIKLFVFKNGWHQWGKQLIGFIASIFAFRLAEYIAFVVFHGLMAVPYTPAYAFILAVSAACKFFFLRQVLFVQPPRATLYEPIP